MKMPFRNNLVLCQEVIYPCHPITVLEYFQESNPTALRLCGITNYVGCMERSRKKANLFQDIVI